MAATLRVRFTTSHASDTSPVWTDVTDQVRSFAISQGTDNEFSQADAATATLVVDNRVQQFDPTTTPAIRPMNRWEITEMITGEVLFVGYARSYTQQWPAPGFDAITVVECVDEFMVLSMDRLPALDPPTAATYADVVQFDQPQGYWQMQDVVDLRVMNPAVGGVVMTSGTISRVSGAIVGDATVDNISGTLYGARSTTTNITTIEDLDAGTPGLPVGGPGDAGGLSEMTFEFWYRSTEATPAADRLIARGPLSSGVTTWSFQHETTGRLAFYARNSGGTLYGAATAASSIAANTWYHVVGAVNGGFTFIYLDSVLGGTTDVFTGSFGAMDASEYMQLGTSTAVGGTRSYDEPAFYRYPLGSDRIFAHYIAGASRGYPADDPDDRADAIMADSTSVAAFDFTSTHGVGREIVPTFQTGQSPLEELRRCEAAEQGFLFVAKDGTVTMLREGYRGDSPYNVVQATFDDDGTDLKFRQVGVDYSSSFLFNEVTMAREGGVTVTDSDTTSINTYLRRPLIIPALPITDDSNIASFVTNLLERYREPINRITALTVDTSEQDVADAVLPLDLGARIAVNVTQPNGGRIQQEMHVMKRTISGTPGAPWIITLGLGWGEPRPDVEAGSFRGLLALTG